MDNGLRVVIERQDRTDQLALHMHVGVGSRDEVEGQRGLAHLFEHLMYEGSRNAPGNAYDELVTGAGGDNNAFTTLDETAYHATVPSGALDRMLFLESDRLGFLRGGLTEEGVKNQIDVVLQERDQSYAALHGKDSDVLKQLLYPEGHPYHRPVIGTVDDIEGFTVDGARAFHERWYRPSNVVLGIVGRLDPEETLEKVKHWFSDVPAVPAEPRGQGQAVLPHHGAPVRGLLADYVDEYTAYLAWYGAPMNSEDEAALVVASFVLSNGRGTRLDRLYYKRGWVADTDARSRSSELDGYFVVSMASERPRFRRMERLATRALRGLVHKPATTDELDRAKTAIRSRLAAQLERPADRAEALVDCLRHTGSADCSAADWARVEAVTAEDIAAAIERMSPTADATLWVAPSSDAVRFADQAPFVEPM